MPCSGRGVWERPELQETGATVESAVFVWLGMVFAISFIEAPLKFRAPGVTIALDVAVLRPRMDRRYTSGNVSDTMPRHRLHLWYVGLELVKVVALVILGITALTRITA